MTDRILYAEDDEADAMLMRATLLEEHRDGGFDVTHVESLHAVMQALEAQPFDALLLDLRLQDVSGLESLTTLAEHYPDLPIIILSGHDDDSTALAAIDHGAQDYIVKGHGSSKHVRLAIQSSIRRKRLERRLYHLANFDELTGLANRRLFEDFLERSLLQAKRWNRRQTILFIDLNGFKAINDTHGHDAGDAILKEAASRMTATLRSSDLIARFGGDEFLILLDNGDHDGENAVTYIIDKLRHVFTATVPFNAEQLSFSASIGSASFPEMGDSAASLLKAADEAMYRMKEARGTAR